MKILNSAMKLQQLLQIKTDGPVWFDSVSLTSIDMSVFSSPHGMYRNAFQFSWITSQYMNQLALFPFTQEKDGERVCMCAQYE